MTKKKQKIAAWFMVIIMVLSAIVGFAAYFIK
jgi:hypothetical protein